MNDPIAEADRGIAALAAFETIARETRNGTIYVATHAGVITSVAATRAYRPVELTEDHALVAAIASDLGYGGLEFVVRDGRIDEWIALPRRRIA